MKYVYIYIRIHTHTYIHITIYMQSSYYYPYALLYVCLCIKLDIWFNKVFLNLEPYTDIWSTKISNEIFIFSGHFINFPCVCEALGLCSYRFAYTTCLLLTIMLTKIPTVYYLGVFSHPSIYNTSALQQGKPIINIWQSYVSRGKILQAETSQAWDIIDVISLYNFSNRGWCSCDYGYFISCICVISKT